MIKDFKKFLDTLSETNASLNYFTDFSKVRKNTAKIEIKLNQLNYFSFYSVLVKVYLLFL